MSQREKKYVERQEEDERARNIQRKWSDRVTRKGGSGVTE